MTWSVRPMARGMAGGFLILLFVLQFLRITWISEATAKIESVNHAGELASTFYIYLNKNI